MAFSVPAHKQTDTAKKPGQIVNRDWYKEHATKLFGVQESEVTPEQRKYAKLDAHAKAWGGHFPMGPK